MVMILTSQREPPVLTVTIAGFLVGSGTSRTTREPRIAVISRSRSNCGAETI